MENSNDGSRYQLDDVKEVIGKLNRTKAAITGLSCSAVVTFSEFLASGQVEPIPVIISGVGGSLVSLAHDISDGKFIVMK